MPHSKQAKKRLRQDMKKMEKNRSIKTAMRTQVKKVLKAVEAKDGSAASEALPLAMKKLDKAAKRNVIHKNQASRKSSRLNRKVDQLLKEQAEAPPPEGE